MQEPLPQVVKKIVSHAWQSYIIKRQKKRTQLVENKLKQFDNLKSLDIETKDTIRQEIEKYQFSILKAEDTHSVFIECCIFIVFTLWLVPILILSHNSQLTDFLISSSSPTTPISLKLFVVLITLIAIILMALFPYAIISPILSFIERAILKRCSFEYIINELLSILFFVEKSPDDWTKFKHKKILLTKIEKTALLIERFLPYIVLKPRIILRNVSSESGEYEPYYTFPIRPGDTITTTWFKETMKQVAYALREKKKWILTPKKDTRDIFLKSIASTLTCLIEGDWDALERKELMKPSPAQIRDTVVKILLKILRTFLIAGLPIIGFLIFQQTSLKLTGTTFGTVVTILTIYAVTVVISSLDPNFSTRITNIKDIRNLWQ